MQTKRAELIAFGVFMGRNVKSWGSGVLAEVCEALTKVSAAAHNLGVAMCNVPAPKNDPEWEKAQGRIRRRLEKIAKEFREEIPGRHGRAVRFALSWDPRGACLRIAFGKTDPETDGYAVPCLSTQ